MNAAPSATTTSSRVPVPRRQARRRIRAVGLAFAVVALASLALPSLAGCGSPRTLPGTGWDLLLRGGLVVDGTGAPPRAADVAVDDGRIVAIGDLSSAAAEAILDVGGRVVAPGFVDVHAHADADAARHGDAPNYVAMGVTTVITGNCGASVARLDEHFTAVERAGIAVNYGSLIGHGTVRREVLGLSRRRPTDPELQQMRSIVDRAMATGAFGMSTGLIYVPGTYARIEEIVALAEVVARHGGVYASHIRNENNAVLDAVDEALAIGTRAGVPVHVSHLKAAGRKNWGRAHEVVAKLGAARTAGQSVTGDVYVYEASSTGLEVLFPTEALEVGLPAFATRLRDDAAFAATMKAAVHEARSRVGFDDFAYVQIANAPNRAQWNGLRIPAVAQALVGRSDADAQADAILALMVASEGRRVQMVYHAIGESDLRTFLREPYVAIAADAGIRIPGGAKPHPRGSGNNVRLLGRYVRDLGDLSLAEGIRRMTTLPAQTFRIEHRGVLQPGAHADIVVFDPDRVADRATYDEPLTSPVGIDHVFVNGVAVIRDGAPTGARPGVVLRATHKR